MNEINQELDFIKSIISAEFTVLDVSSFEDDDNIFTFVVKNKKYECIISYIREFEIFLLTTVRETKKSILTFEGEFWFQDNYTQQNKDQFNQIILDFVNEESSYLLDKKYPCEIEYL